MTAGAGLVAAAAAVVALVLGVQVHHLQQPGDALQASPQLSAAERAALAVAVDQEDPAGRHPATGPAATPATIVLTAAGTGFVDRRHGRGGLARCLSDRTYQLWGVVGSRTISLGLLGPHPGIVPFSVAGTAPVTAFAITDEVAGGVVTSAHQPVAVGVVRVRASDPVLSGPTPAVRPDRQVVRCGGPGGARPRRSRPAGRPAGPPRRPVRPSGRRAPSDRRRPVGVQPVAARPLGHPHHGVGQQQPVVRVEAGVDERVDGLGDGLLHPAEGGAELGVVGGVPPVEQPEGVLVVDHEFEVAGETELDLLAGALGGGGGLDDPVDQLAGRTTSRSSR